LKNVVLKHASAVLAALATAAFGLAFAQGPQPSPQPTAPKPTALSDALPIPPAPAPKSAAAWILIDYATGQVLAGENYDVRREPASITKVMTSYVIAADMAACNVKADYQFMLSEHAWR
jgi:D-alanyl-D-alanine carboxypeptidase (penicillin-binding protein 5/6)